MAMQRSELRDVSTHQPPPEWWQVVWTGLDRAEEAIKRHNNLPGSAEAMDMLNALRAHMTAVLAKEEGRHDV